MLSSGVVLVVGSYVAAHLGLIPGAAGSPAATAVYVHSLCSSLSGTGVTQHLPSVLYAGCHRAGLIVRYTAWARWAGILMTIGGIALIVLSLVTRGRRWQGQSQGLP